MLPGQQANHLFLKVMLTEEESCGNQQVVAPSEYIKTFRGPVIALHFTFVVLIQNFYVIKPYSRLTPRDLVNLVKLVILRCLLIVVPQTPVLNAIYLLLRKTKCQPNGNPSGQ